MMPSVKEIGIEGDYKYEVRIHEVETQYGKTGIYRVSRQRVNLPAGQQGTGVEYIIIFSKDSKGAMENLFNYIFIRKCYLTTSNWGASYSHINTYGLQ